MEEKDLRRILQQDLSAGTEAFRDGLLMRCLPEVNAGMAEGVELADDELEMLAAAGEPATWPDSTITW